MRSKRQSHVLVLAVVMGALGWCASGSADTIRLKNGKTVEGQVVREDEASVTVMIGSRPEFYARTEIESMSRGLHLNLSTTPPSTTEMPAQTRVAIDETLLKQIGRRVRAVHECLHQLYAALLSLRTVPSSQALEQMRRAVTLVLPTHGGAWDSGTLLVDLLIVVLLRAPMVWIASAVVRGQPQFLRAVAFAVLAYGLTRLAAVVMGSALAQPLALAWLTGLIVMGVVVGVTVPLFMRMFNLGLVPAVVALIASAGLSVGVDQLLLTTGVL